MDSRVIKFAASSLVLSMTTSACTVSSQGKQAPQFRASRSERPAKLHHQAQEALEKGNIAVATAALEEAVALAPQDAGYRMGLAEVYMRSGRFASAETAFTDVLALNPTDSRAGFYLALTQIAQGKTGAALAQLDSMNPEVAPADIGLAYAIAGNSRRALALLEPAARSHQATGRIRQNLALAYAFAGDWKRARATAAQDVAASEINARMIQWAALADPSASITRVASLLGVTPVENDPGQPVRLALAPPAPVVAAVVEPAAAADAYVAAPTATPAPVIAASSETYAAAPAAVSVYAEAPIAAPAPVLAPAYAESAPVAANVPAATAAPVEATYVQASEAVVQAPAPAPVVAASIVPVSIPAYVSPQKARAAVYARSRSRSLGRYVVQLGAYRTRSQVELAWANAQRRYRFGTGYEPVSTSVTIPGKGVFHRLSVASFNSQPAAARLCQNIRSRGGACFVRTIAGDTRVQWASRYARRA